MGRSGQAQAPRPCMQVRPVCGQRAHSSSSRPPGSLRAGRLLLGEGRRCAKGPSEESPPQSEKQEGKEVERKLRHGSHSQDEAVLCPWGDHSAFAFLKELFLASTSWISCPSSHNPLLSPTHTPQCSMSVY